MIFVNPADFGILPERDISEALAELCLFLKNEPGEKTVKLNKGTYYISSDKCQKQLLFISNTTADSEYSEKETPHLNTLAFHLNEVSDLIFDGSDSVFIIDGKATNLALTKSQNVVIKNLELRHRHPDMHCLKAVSVNAFSADFEIDRDSLFFIKKGRLFFHGNNYCVPGDKRPSRAPRIALINPDDEDKVKAGPHPLKGKIALRHLGENKIRVYYAGKAKIKEGASFYIYDLRRQSVGIFGEKSKNITFENIRQRFNYSLGLIMQDCENITVDSVEFAPEADSQRLIASCADFMHFSMCRGKIAVRNSRFEGSCDDCLNVHGIHFKITSKKNSTITVRFMHPQTHGFNPLRENDEIAFIDPDTLLEKAKAKILKSRLINERDILLTLDSTENAVIGDMIEDISACPEVCFSGNTIKRIITRGLLLTTRGKVNIENNRFISSHMSSILLSDDAKSWFESGMCLDVSIKDNCFEYCGESPIVIKPENKKHGGAVHKNIRITDNCFKEYKGAAIDISSSENIIIRENSFSASEVKTKNCSNVTF